MSGSSGSERNHNSFTDRPRILPRIRLHSEVRKSLESAMKPTHAAFRTLLIYVSLASPLAWADTPASSDGTDHRCGGEPCAAVFRGLVAFFDRDLHGLDGNGRSCADCHMVTEQFRLTPAAAESRFQRLQKRRQFNPWADDPLFRPID